MLGFRINERGSKFTQRPFTFRESFAVVAKVDHFVHKFTLSFNHLPFSMKHY